MVIRLASGENALCEMSGLANRLAPAWLVLLLVCGALAVVPTVAAVGAEEQPVAWQDLASPYRAEFEVVSPADEPEAGIAVQVPVCGLGAADGSDVCCRDPQGRKIPVLPMGEGVGNTALVLVRPPPDCRRFFCYFGSNYPATKSPADFKPGLTVDVRALADGSSGNSRKDLETALARSTRLARLPVGEISMPANPVDFRDTYVLVFEGFLRVPKEEAGPRTLMLVANDAGWLEVRGRTLAEIYGRHGAGDSARGEFKGALDLPAGLSPVTCVVANLGQDGMALVGDWHGPRDKAVLRPRNFLKSGSCRLTGVGCRDADGACPAFQYRILSYIGYQDVQYTEVQLESCNGRAAEWRFGDGSRLDGAKVSKLFVGLGTRAVTVRQGNVEARGRVMFPQAAPPQADIGRTADFIRYSGLITQEDGGRLEAATLQAFRSFLGWRERNPDLIPFCQTLIRQAASPTARFQYGPFLELARAAAAGKPDLAAQAYARLLAADSREPWWTGAAEEYAEFALFRQRDCRLAAAITDTLEKKGGAPAAPAVLTLRFLTALQEGKADRAKELLAELRRQAVSAANATAAVIRRNELEERFYGLLRRGFLQQGSDVLGEWGQLWPDDWITGRLPLARANFWRAAGWPRGALAELDGAVLLNPLLPNLPDAELARAEALLDLGDAAKARERLQAVIGQYPNHPAAAAARALLEKLR